jgi:hypothetical protein
MASRYSPQARARRASEAAARQTARQQRIAELTAAGRRRTASQKAELNRLREIERSAQRYEQAPERAAKRAERTAERDADRDYRERVFWAARFQELLPDEGNVAERFLAAPLSLQRLKIKVEKKRHLEREAERLPPEGYDPTDGIIPGIGAAYHW